MQLIGTHFWLLISASLTRVLANLFRAVGLSAIIAPSPPAFRRPPQYRVGEPGLISAFSSFFLTPSGGIGGGGLSEFNRKTAWAVLPLAVIYAGKVVLSNVSYAYASSIRILNPLSQDIQLRRDQPLHHIPDRQCTPDSGPHIIPDPNKPLHLDSLLSSYSRSQPLRRLLPTLHSHNLGIHPIRHLQHSLRLPLSNHSPPHPPPTHRLSSSTKRPPKRRCLSTRPGPAVRFERSIKCLLATPTLHILPFDSRCHAAGAHFWRIIQHRPQLLLP